MVAKPKNTSNPIKDHGENILPLVDILIAKLPLWIYTLIMKDYYYIPTLVLKVLLGDRALTCQEFSNLIASNLLPKAFITPISSSLSTIQYTTFHTQNTSK